MTLWHRNQLWNITDDNVESNCSLTWGNRYQSPGFWRHPHKYPYKHPYKFWRNGIYVIWKYKTVSCCDWHIWKERKGNDGGGRFEESSQFPWIFSYTSHYWRLGKNEISELAPSSSPEISSDRERVSGVWWVCQINVKNLPELAPRRRSAEELRGCLACPRTPFGVAAWCGLGNCYIVTLEMDIIDLFPWHSNPRHCLIGY